MTRITLSVCVALFAAACGSASSGGDDGAKDGSGGETNSAGQPGATAGQSGEAGSPAGGEGGAPVVLPLRPGRWYQGCGRPIPEHTVTVENAGAGGESSVDVPATTGCTAGLECVEGVCSFRCSDTYPGELGQDQARCAAMGGTCEGAADGQLICTPLH